MRVQFSLFFVDGEVNVAQKAIHQGDFSDLSFRTAAVAVRNPYRLPWASGMP